MPGCTTYRRFCGIRPRGVALVAVLALLTIITLLAIMFVVLVEIERLASNQTLAGMQARLMALSAHEHALAILACDTGEAPGCTHPGQAWHTVFSSSRRRNGGEPVLGSNGRTNDAGGFAEARWFTIRNSAGVLVGRYAVIIEDEAAKLNINVASATGTNGQNQGVSTTELLLADGVSRGLPLGVSSAQRIVDARYGADRKPGIASRDDNFNAAESIGDETDNDADGIVDEQDEGTDEPGEFAADRPQGDDRPFFSVLDLASLGLPELRAQPALMRQLSTIATTR